MKVRSGFVSNSSSSSFVCDISGEITSGYDMCFRDAGMTRFYCGHTVSDKYADDARKQFLSQPYGKIAEQLREYCKEASSFFLANIEKHGMSIEDSFEETCAEFGLDDELPSSMCPICNLKYVTKDSVLAYLLKSSAMEIDDVVNNIKDTFGKQPDVFWAYIKGVNTNVDVQVER